MMVDAGPLGFAALVNGNAQPGDAGRPRLPVVQHRRRHVVDEDLTAAGMPADSYPSQVIVGSDHIGIDYQSGGGGPNEPDEDDDPVGHTRALTVSRLRFRVARPVHRRCGREYPQLPLASNPGEHGRALDLDPGRMKMSGRRICAAWPRHRFPSTS